MGRKNFLNARRKIQGEIFINRKREVFEISNGRLKKTKGGQFCKKVRVKRLNKQRLENNQEQVFHTTDSNTNCVSSYEPIIASSERGISHIIPNSEVPSEVVKDIENQTASYEQEACQEVITSEDIATDALLELCLVRRFCSPPKRVSPKNGRKQFSNDFITPRRRFYTYAKQLFNTEGYKVTSNGLGAEQVPLEKTGSGNDNDFATGTKDVFLYKEHSPNIVCPTNLEDADFQCSQVVISSESVDRLSARASSESQTIMSIDNSTHSHSLSKSPRTHTSVPGSLTPNGSGSPVKSDLLTRSIGIQCNLPLAQTRSISIQCERSLISYHSCKKMSPKDFRFFTGVTQETFEVLYDFLGGYEVCSQLKYAKTDGTPRRRIGSQFIDPPSRFFMTLLRLRRGIPVRDLAYIFNLSVSLTASILYTWIRFISVQFEVLRKKLFISRETQNVNKPECFQPFPNIRGVMDCTDFATQQPFNFQMQSNMYSPYKSCNDLKYLIVCSVYGGIMFLSRGFEGSISDKDIFLKCGVIDLLSPGDAIMCDRGFDIEAELNEIDVDLIMPPFLGERKHFTAAELTRAKEIARARIFIEIVNKRIKDFRIFHGRIPNKLLPIMDDMVFICGILSQFDHPFIDQKSLVAAIKSVEPV